MNRLFILFVSLGLFFQNMDAQEFKMPVLSPFAKVEQQFSTSNIIIEYSRPSKRGRTIFGDVVPYGKNWRTGANSNTKISFGEDVKFAGNNVPAGTYSLYTIPNAENWEIILNKSTENWGTAGYDAQNDLVRINVRPIHLNNVIETFTIEIANITTTSCILNLKWDQTLIPIQIEADTKERILTYLEKELQGEKPPYQQAANYYLEQNYKLNDALTYINKAIESNKEAYWLYWTKAQISAKLNKKNEALEAAQKAMDLTKNTDAEQEYLKKYQKLKVELK